MRVIKAKPGRYLIVPDTSVLWCDDKVFCVSSEFEKFWLDHESQFEIELHVPETVRGELLFQQTTSALKSLKKITDELSRLSAICEKSRKLKITQDLVKRDVRTKFDRWMKKRGATLIQTPIANIKWDQILEAAVWRNPPFEFDAKEESEKGFRDAIILETLVHFCTRRNENSTVIFLCNDGTLRDSADEKLKSNLHYLSFPSTGDLASHLRLRKEHLTKEFTTLITAKASKRFFKAGDSASLYYSEKIFDQISNRFKALIDAPDELDGGGKSAFAAFNLSFWRSILNPRVSVGDAQFDKITAEGRYHWNNTILYIRAYKALFEGNFFSTVARKNAEHSDTKVLRLSVRVGWSVKVKSDGRFQDARIETVEKDKADFSQPSEQESIRLGIVPAT